MNARGRFLLLTSIMIGVCAIVLMVTTVILYRHNLNEHANRLEATVQGQARLIEAMARHDSIYEQNTPGGPVEATLSQIVDAHERYDGFGETGEFILARHDGDSIVFVLRRRYGTIEHPAAMTFDSELVEPMRRALKGQSGMIIGLDYRGETVCAAYEPVALLNLGIVAKIDLSEIRAPFIRASLSATAVALIVILAGTVLFFWIGNPIIARLEKHSRDLEQKNAELERFNYTISHDLRTPLVTITGFLDLLELNLKDSEKGPEVKHALEVINSAAIRMANLLRDLLKLSRLGHLINPPEECALGSLIDDVLGQLSGPITDGKVQIDVDPDLPTVFADPIGMFQVMQNLIENAIKFKGEQNSLKITIGSRENEGKQVIYVRDNGIGIDPEQHKRIFDLFQQLAPTQDGSGVGLPLVKRIIELHGGRIWVESEGVGKGSAFLFTLPQQEAY